MQLASAVAPKPLLHWLGPELARGGFLRNEDWVVAASTAAEKLYDDEELKIAGVLFAALTPHALDYLRQAPILALMISNGGKLTSQKVRRRIALETAPLLTKNPKLKALLRHYNLPLPLRALQGRALHIMHWPEIECLALINPSTLAQIIPRRVRDQSMWLSNLRRWNNQMWAAPNARLADSDDLFAWAAGAYANADGRTLQEVVDFARAAPASFNLRWTLSQAYAAALRWHEELARMSGEERFLHDHGMGWEDPVDYGPLPLEVNLGDYQIVALRSGKDLFEEGRAMRHCVASYFRQVLFGASRLYSVRQGEKRLATFELTPSVGGCTERWANFSTNERGNRVTTYHVDREHYGLDQCKGPCNAAPVPSVSAAVSKFVKQLKEHKQ